VAHACNPSHSRRGRDQEDPGSEPTWANSLHDPISKNSSQKRAGRVAHGVGLEFKPQYHKKKKIQRTKQVVREGNIEEGYLGWV
jgi:hypothetical protein